MASGQVMQSDTHRTVEPFLARGVRLPPDSVFGLIINKIETIPGTKIWIWRVAGAPAPLDVAARGKDGRSRRTLAEAQLEAFVHQRYYPLIEATEFDGFFSNKRTVLATDLRVADRGGGVNGHPVYTLLPTTSLAFELRIKDDPNLPDMLRTHTDEKLLKNIFGVCYNGGKFSKCTEPLFNADQLWCRIEYIGPVERVAHNGKQVDCLTIECVLEHEDPETAVNIVLWEEAVAMEKLLKSDYYIGLLCPVVVSQEPGSPAIVEYGGQTITFMMCGIRNSTPTYASQLSIAYNGAGFLDYRRYAHKLQLCQCRKDMIHLTLISRIVAVSDNMPYIDSKGSIDRYAVRLDDGTAVCDMTLWGKAGRLASRLLPGQLVLWQNVETTVENGDVILNGSDDDRTTFFNISEMSGVLVSATLCSYTSLAQLPRTANRYVKARIVEVISASEQIRDARDRISATTLVHTLCRRRVVCSDKQSSQQLENPTDFYYFDCPSCNSLNLKTEDVVAVFVIRARIDDGTDSIVVDVAAAAAMDILRIPPEQFLSLSNQREQQNVLLEPKGREIVVSITSYCAPLSTERDIRIDAVCDAADVGAPSLV
ncbi:hypothetical protein COEREDRAFT_88258 [Coemansia reversa NRRL 1564]|uniref:Cell division control protein 24 OB domain-containing protein n=1 Tax=Coemansia reversa (strain ATCC 12441 / NRRL 1564) TaxID=763665 RepID=A0A2G5B7H5_COERN|nr:hypothetical protein COEREDRAFT_88258 [Coemansia reversa NRRL 1564]|eukprot:PIA14934.1 hypothetical protein COEREDRAFT_88258 [Coemansia reversa NRRL 1564]